MLDRRALLLSLVMAFATFGASHGQAFEPDHPGSFVEAFMQRYVSGDGPEPLYTPAVTTRLKKAALDYDFIVGGQDYEVKNIRVTEVANGPDWLEIEARFMNFGRQRRVSFDYRFVDAGWRIANVRVGTEFDLRRTLGLAPLDRP